MKNRAFPKRGELIAVPLQHGWWGYVVCYGLQSYYAYKFVSQGLVFSLAKELFCKENWLSVLTIFGMTRAFRTIGLRDIERKDLHPLFISYFEEFQHHDPRRIAGDSDAGWFAHDGTRNRIPIKVSEIPNYLPIRGLRANEVQAYYDEVWDKLIKVEGDPKLLPPGPEPEEDTSIVLELDFLGSVNPAADMEDAINEALEYEGVDYECMGSDGWSGDKSDSTLLLAGIRRGLKKVLPKEEWELVKIIKRGPGQDQVKTFGLEPTPRKKPQVD